VNVSEWANGDVDDGHTRMAENLWVKTEVFRKE
jgi:hypothetical protein